MAAPASAAERSWGRASVVGRSRRGGRMRSRQRRNAIGSPASARSIALRVSASASPSSNASAARVARWRAPLGLPAGFPDRPLAKGRSRCICSGHGTILSGAIDQGSVPSRCSPHADPHAVSTPTTSYLSTGLLPAHAHTRAPLWEGNWRKYAQFEVYRPFTRSPKRTLGVVRRRSAPARPDRAVHGPAEFTSASGSFDVAVELCK
jgi:hypothetical protein